jgi:hypothetical protein
VKLSAAESTLIVTALKELDSSHSAGDILALLDRFAHASQPKSTQPCPYCGGLERKPNGMCPCRIKAYRERIKAQKAAQKVETEQLSFETPAVVHQDKRAVKAAQAKARKAATLTVVEQPVTVEQPVIVEHKAVVDPFGGYVCTCGFVGRGNLPSVRSHATVANRRARTSA